MSTKRFENHPLGVIHNIGNSYNRKPNYYEAFLGGGALFFGLKSKYGDKFNNYYLSDINLDLVTSYNAVKNYPYKVINHYQELFKNHSKEFYLNLRERPVSPNPVHISARFLYLNRYSFVSVNL